ncbi:hypothetical protein ACQPU1_05165 [Clostridium paraputrificum]|uniref:hypothetical protein n=1 Tax=Clostridium TaxID=1485 RepID=UPI003D356FF1
MINNLTLSEYLLEKDIIVTEECFKGRRLYTEEEVFSQIILIEDIHRILMDYGRNGSTRINSTIGKNIETIKVELKRLRKDFEFRENLKEKNEMDYYIMENGENILYRAEEALKRLNEIDYIGIIKRSMKKNEICLGRVDEGNLRVIDAVEIGNLKNISYNLIEEDICAYLKKVRRRLMNVSIESCIDKYIELSHLNKDSEEYIKIHLSVPYDSLKQWYRYRQNKRGLLPDEYLKNIKSSLKYENEIL